MVFCWSEHSMSSRTQTYPPGNISTLDPLKDRSEKASGTHCPAASPRSSPESSATGAHPDPGEGSIGEANSAKCVIIGSPPKLQVANGSSPVPLRNNPAQAVPSSETCACGSALSGRTALLAHWSPGSPKVESAPYT